MNWEHLFTMQKQLDNYIEKKHELQAKHLFDKKVLALLVEVGELANETRCFKFWSNKQASAQDVILEEYVDGIHFILSLGLETNYTFESSHIANSNQSLTDVFNSVFKKIIAFKLEPSKEKYQQMFDTYICLGKLLGFNENSVIQAYYQKNKVNFERQDQGY